MVCIGIAQIEHKLACIEKEIDFLAEPGFSLKEPHFASLIHKISESQNEMDEFVNIQNTLRQEYITYICNKLEKICLASKNRNVDILVFPEYSIPYQCLPRLQELANEQNMTIIAGSHTVHSSAKDYYQQAGLSPEIADEYSGFSICPILYHNKPAEYQLKCNRSIFEQTMKEVPADERKVSVFTTETREKTVVNFSVIICADAMFPDCLNSFYSEKKDKQPVLFIIGCSTSTRGFVDAADQAALHKIPTFICNTSTYGHSQVFLPEPVKQRFKNAEQIEIGKNEEGLLVTDINQEHFFATRGVLDNAILGNCSFHPIVYSENEQFHSDYNQTISDVKKNLVNGTMFEVDDTLELFKICYEGKIPKQMEAMINRLQTRCSNFCGDPEEFLQMYTTIILDMYDTKVHFGRELVAPIQFAQKLRRRGLEVLSVLYELEETYPKSSDDFYIKPIMPKSVLKQDPTISEIESFRDRSTFFNQLQNNIDNPNVRLILINGAYGIGKTSAIRVAFKRHFPDWKIKYIELPSNISFAMALEYMANSIGEMLRADSLTRNGKKITTRLMNQFVNQLFSQKGRVIVVDNLESIIYHPQGKDVTLLTLFREEISKIKVGSGKVIFVSDVLFSKELFPDSIENIRRIPLTSISDNIHIQRIITYEMRKHNMLEPEMLPNIPDFVFELVSGHPLTAKLCVEVAYKNKMDSLKDISPLSYRKDIIAKLMKKITLEKEQEDLLSFLSVFRSAIEEQKLLACLPEVVVVEFKKNKKCLEKLSFVSIAGNSIEIVAIIRQYFYEKLSEDKRKEYHQYALNYYKNLQDSLKTQNKFSAFVYSEIAFHLTYLGKANLITQYLPLDGNIDAIKTLARGLYREKKYNDAQQIYQILETACKDDVEVLSYLGRCFARLGSWDRVQEYFESAIKVATEKKEYTWYLYRDLGHLYVRYRMDSDAELNFKKAREFLKLELGKDDEPSILASEGSMLERDGDRENAIKKYEAALSLRYDHEFTIVMYSKLLKSIGEVERANELENRIMVGDYTGYAYDLSSADYEITIIDGITIEDD